MTGVSSLEPTVDPPGERRAWRPRRIPAGVPLGVLILVAVAHAAAVAPTYGFGSFDDDASYVEIARALASGHGLASNLTAGYPLTATYPPGYPVLLIPFTFLGSHQVIGYRLLSVALLVVLLVLVDRWLVALARTERAGVDRAGVERSGPLHGVLVTPWVRWSVLGVLALNPIVATYATMVMAEMLFLVLFLLWMLFAQRWGGQGRAITRSAVATVFLGSALLWVKEAGIGLVGGLFLWQLCTRRWRQAAVTALGSLVLMSPLIVIRLVEHSPLLGSRYSGEIGAQVGHTIGDRISAAGTAIRLLATQVVPVSVIPNSEGGLPLTGISWLKVAIGVFLLLGAVLAWRRWGGLLGCAMLVYLAEILNFPYVNERRLILVLPVVVLWSVLGLQQALRWIPALLTRRIAAAVIVLAVVGVLAPQFQRNYLYESGVASSMPDGSTYMSLLSRLGSPHDIVEADYLWTTSLMTGHRTANGLYTAETVCGDDEVWQTISDDGAGYLMSDALNVLGVGNPCALQTVSVTPHRAVRLYRAPTDSASLFELVGSGTGNPTLANLLAGATATTRGAAAELRAEPSQAGEKAGSYPVAPVVDGVATLTWPLSDSATVTQVSLGDASASGGTSRVVVSVRENGSWQTVQSVPSPVGAWASTKYLLTKDLGVHADQVRVQVFGAGTAQVHDLAVIGRP